MDNVRSQRRTRGESILQSRYWLFTSYLDRGTIGPILERLVGSNEASYVVYQTEKCPSTGRSHQQGYVVLLKKQRRNKLSSTLLNAHLESRNGTHTQAVKYCTKEETRIEGPFYLGEDPGERHQGRRSDLEEVAELLRAGKTKKEVYDACPEVAAKYGGWIETYGRMLRREQMLAGLQPFLPRPGWQTSLHDLLGGEPDSRKIHWRFEYGGNVGKSYFALHYDPANTFIITSGKHADIIYAYSGERVVFFDWSRKAEDSFPYGLAESFKNGYFLSTKYQSQQMRFPVPHVVVFANFDPQRSALSEDRWDIELINND